MQSAFIATIFLIFKFTIVGGTTTPSNQGKNEVIDVLEERISILESVIKQFSGHFSDTAVQECAVHIAVNNRLSVLEEVVMDQAVIIKQQASVIDQQSVAMAQQIIINNQQSMAMQQQTMDNQVLESDRNRISTVKREMNELKVAVAEQQNLMTSVHTATSNNIISITALQTETSNLQMDLAELNDEAGQDDFFFNYRLNNMYVQSCVI